MTPVQVYEMVERLTNGKMADVTINCVNVPDQEMTAVLCTKDDGIVYFFSMATSFTKASLGAEGIGSDVNMIMGTPNSPCRNSAKARNCVRFLKSCMLNRN